MSGHIAVIFAAGGSRRLGRPKQLLTRDGEPLVHRVTRLAIATSPLRTLVVLGAWREEIAPTLAGLECDVAINADWDTGVAGSIAVARNALRGHEGPVLLSACDQPGLVAAHFVSLVRGAQAARAGCAATIHEDGAGSPVVVPAAMLSDGEELSGDRGIAARIRRLPEDAVFLLDAPELRPDIDTETDLRVAIEQGWVDASCAASTASA